MNVKETIEGLVEEFSRLTAEVQEREARKLEIKGAVEVLQSVQSGEIVVAEATDETT